MNQASPPRRQALLAYALLASVLAALWVAAGQPLLSKLSQGEVHRAALEVRIDSLERAAARDPALRPAVAREQIGELESFIGGTTVKADTLEVGGSLLQRRLVEIIRRHGGEPGNIRLATAPGAGIMTVSTRFSADLPDIAELLLELQRSRPMMFVDLLSIRLRDPNLEVADREDAPGLIVQIDVSAFWGGPSADGSG